MVYQRRMVVEAMKTKALLMATLNPERAEKAAQDYFQLAMPVSEDELDAQHRAKERALEEMMTMAPIPVTQIRAGAALAGTQQWGSSMHKG